MSIARPLTHQLTRVREETACEDYPGRSLEALPCSSGRLTWPATMSGVEKFPPRGLN